MICTGCDSAENLSKHFQEYCPKPSYQDRDQCCSDRVHHKTVSMMGYLIRYVVHLLEVNHIFNPDSDEENRHLSFAQMRQVSVLPPIVMSFQLWGNPAVPTHHTIDLLSFSVCIRSYKLSSAHSSAEEEPRTQGGHGGTQSLLLKRLSASKVSILLEIQETICNYQQATSFSVFLCAQLSLCGVRL